MSDATTGTADALPPQVAAVIGKVQYEIDGDFPVEQGYIFTSCSSVENGNPLFWDPVVAAALTDGPIAPPTMLSVWFRPHHWAPGRTEEVLPLQVHFDLKAIFELPEAVMTDNTIVFHEPVRPGDVLKTRQVLQSVSGPKTTKLGTGRFWVIDVEYLNQDDVLVGGRELHGVRLPEGRRMSDDLLLDSVQAGDTLPELGYDVTATTIVLGALAARDWRPMHHDHDFAVNRNGTQNIFLNTPHQAAWFERYITDWTGPRDGSAG